MRPSEPPLYPLPDAMRRQARADFESLAGAFDISFAEAPGLKQTEEFFWATIDGARRRIAMHDYDALYGTPGLYEAVVFGALACDSPFAVIEIVAQARADGRISQAPPRILELGAGSGVFGALARQALSPELLVGVDLSPVAGALVARTRPEAYDQYLIADLAELGPHRAALREMRFNLVGGVSAMGPGHIPPAGLDAAYDLLEPGGAFLFHARPDDGNLGPEGRNVHREWIARRFASQRLKEVWRETRFHRRSSDGGEIFYEVVLALKP